MRNNEDSDWLLVPMEVSALTVGKDAKEVGKHSWSDLAPDYSKIWNDFALVGPDLVTLFPQGGSDAPPGEGIHLHWFLPEAFGHGVEKQQGSIDYPHIPNRWLVRRVRYTPNTCDVRDVAGWIVESDFLHQTKAEQGVEGKVSIPHPDRPMLFDSVGRVTPLQDWTESSPAYRFKLTAIGSGSPDFSAYYPACKSVLGFYDDEPGDWDVSYLVTGWCSDPKQDLLHGVTAEKLSAKLEELQWSSSSTGLPSRVLCHGAVSRIAWHKNGVHQSPLPTGKATVCVGNTSAEALATLLARKMGNGNSDASLIEPLLSAFQYDMLGSGQHLGDVHAELHRHRFVSSPGGDRYTIEAKRKALDTTDAVSPQEQPTLAQCLPPDIESALYDLNAKARQAARLQRELGSLRQALFTTWCLWAKQYTDDSEEPIALTPELNRSRAEVAAGARDTQASQAAHLAARDTLEGILAARLPDLELASSMEHPFYRATDPAVLVAGMGLAPSGVYDTYVRPEQLPCRQKAEIVAGLSADIQNTGELGQIFARVLDRMADTASWPSLGEGPSSDLLDALLRELLVLDPVDPQQQPPVPPLADRLTEEFNKCSSIRLSDTVRKELRAEIVKLLTESAVSTASLTSHGTGITPQRPDERALFRWQRNPWRPLLLEWEVKWHPDPGQDGEGDLAEAWQPWSLDKQGNEFQLPSPIWPAPTQAITYQSYTMLTPHAAWVLRRRLEALVKRKPNEKLSAVMSNIDSLEVLSQSLGGFHDALRQIRHGLQLPPINPVYVIADDPASTPKLDAVADKIDGIDPLDLQHMHAPDADKDFLPIRAGHVEISRLWLVDSFGQTRKLIDGTQQEYELFTSFGLPGPSQVADRLIPLPPRYVQPARLDFQWLSADEDHPGGSPLCGWIFPNHLDQSLMICDAVGKLWGALQMIIRVDLAGGTGGIQGRGSMAFFWVPVPGTEATPTDIPDPRLRAFVRNLLGLGADAGTDFLKTIAAAQEDTGAAPEHDPRLSILIGRPLALARASLQIELMGLPVRRVPPTTSAETAPGDPTHGFTRVRFPVRLGGPAGHAGGLAGYFVDGEDGTFYPRHGLTGRDFPSALEHGHELSLDAAHAIELTLLLDPGAPVHARCGLLPRHSLHLPEAVVAGVSSIRDVFFQSAPLVGPPGGPRVPRPSDDYGQWSWAARPRVTYWQEYAEITDPGDRGGFEQSPLELQEGWLKLVMNPVNIAAFWVKEGSVTVPAGTRVTLGWMVEGAETLTLSVKDTGLPLESWTKRPGSSLPEEYRLQVSESIRVSLTAMDQRGNRSVKSLQLNVTQGQGNG